MKIEEFQVAYIRSSRLFRFLEAPVIGGFVRAVMADRCLKRSRRLLAVMRELEQYEALQKQKGVSV